MCQKNISGIESGRRQTCLASSSPKKHQQLFPYLENPFWELLPKLHFSTGIAEFKKIRRKQKNCRQSSTLPKYGFMGCAYL